MKFTSKDFVSVSLLFVVLIVDRGTSTPHHYQQSRLLEDAVVDEPCEDTKGTLDIAGVPARQCKWFASRDKCDSYEGKVSEACPVSCGVCVPPVFDGPCEDTEGTLDIAGVPARQCKWFVSRDYCDEYGGKVKEACPRSCGVCVPPVFDGPCEDTEGTLDIAGVPPRQCKWFVSRDYCDEYAGKVKEACPVSCDVCSVPTVSPATDPTSHPTDAASMSPSTASPTNGSSSVPTNPPSTEPTFSPTDAPSVYSTTAPPTVAYKYEPVLTYSWLNSLVSNYCFDPEGWESHRWFPTYGPIETWDVSGITTMISIFASERECNPDISNWDVSASTSFMNMFYDARAFNRDLSKWDVSNSNDFYGMFSRAHAFNQDLSTWDVSSSTRFRGMFSEASVFNQDLSSWDVSLGLTFWYMFAKAYEFNQDLSSWDVSSGTDFTQMFEEATAFNQDICEWEVDKFDLTTKFCYKALYCGECTECSSLGHWCHY